LFEVNSYGLNGMGLEAVELFSKIPKKMLNERTYICVLNACSHSGLVDQAKKIFENIPDKTEFIYTTMV
jgi:pentatricopeptide repeat protein